MLQQREFATVRDALSRLPPRQLVVHCVCNQPLLADLSATVPGIRQYAERGVLLARAQDVVLLLEEMDHSYLSYLNELGFPIEEANLFVVGQPSATTKIRPLSTEAMADPATLRALAAKFTIGEPLVLNCHLTTRAEQDLADRLSLRLRAPVQSLHGDWSAIEEFHSKIRGRELATSLGIPVAPGEVVELCAGPEGLWDTSRLVAAANRWQSHTGQVIFRGDIGASGSSVHCVRNKPSLHRALVQIQRGENSRYLVEALYPLRRSPNVCLYIDPFQERIDCLGISDQILRGGTTHAGNAFPSQTRDAGRLIEYSRRLCERLREAGVTGFVGIDFCEPSDPRWQPGLFFAELNPRVNGATYGKTVLEHIAEPCTKRGSEPPSAYITMDISSACRTFGELTRDYGKHWLTPRSSAGIVPYNVGRLRHGKWTLAIVGRGLGECRSIYRSFRDAAAQIERSASRPCSVDRWAA